MSCNRNEKCRVIANNYNSRKNSIDSNCSNMKNNVSMISRSLNFFDIPDDYIGNKVKSKIEEITKNLKSSSDGIDAFKQNIDSFIDEKESEHNNHYWSWKKKQDELALEESGDTDG